jgi:hypothetical protein
MKKICPNTFAFVGKACSDKCICFPQKGKDK